MEVEGKAVKMRGLDLLHFSGSKLTRKMAYCKAQEPAFED
jgi:hypothetical protein